MGDRYGDAGPPEEAYSRVSRDLAAVSEGFARWLEALPDRLSAAYACRVRPLTGAEEARLRRARRGLLHGYAVEPADSASATVLVGATLCDGGAGVVLGVGATTTEPVPDCWCDACDEDSDGMVEQAEQLVHLAVAGFHEYRRPHRHRRLADRVLSGPWLEEGYESAQAQAGRAGADVRGELFERDWHPWAARS